MRVIAISTFVLLIFSNNSFACKPSTSDFLVTEKSIKHVYRNVINVSGNIQNNSCLSSYLNFSLNLYAPEASLIASEKISYEYFEKSKIKQFNIQFVINFDKFRTFSDKLKNLYFEIKYIKGQSTRYGKSQRSKDNPQKSRPVIIHLESPQNGLRGVKAGDPIIVEGVISEEGITEAKLLLNGKPITLKVKDGRFKREILLPDTCMADFLVIATGKNGQTSGSATHSVFMCYDTDRTCENSSAIILESPANGTYGAKPGDPVIVKGTINDIWNIGLTKAELLLNGVPIPLKVSGGRFKRKIFLPEKRVATFRIMATWENGKTCYSKIHTVLIGYNIDIRNPEPY